MSNQDRLKNAFSQVILVEPTKIADGLIFGSPGWDSVAHMALISAIENEFAIMIDTADVIAMSSFAKAKEIVAKYGVDLNA